MTAEERLRETENFLHEQIPLTRAMQLRVASYDAEGFVLSAPLAPNHNHLGTAFGGSLAALALLAGYGLLWLELADRQAHLVVRESRMQFRRPVRGEFRALCRAPSAESLGQFKKDFAAQGKARIELEVLIEEGGEVAVRCQGSYVALR